MNIILVQALIAVTPTVAMTSKIFFVLCAQAFLIQTAFSQCTSRAAIDASRMGPYGRGGPGLGGSALAYDGLVGNGLAGRGVGCNGGFAPAMEFTATSGGSLPVTSSSAIAPTGISVKSENVFEGPLSVAGELPFVGTTGMDGALPAAGAGAVNHACGDGQVAMVSEASIAPTAAVGPATIGSATGLSGFGPSGFGSAGFGSAGFGPSGFGPGLGLSGFGTGFGITPSNRLGLGGCGRGNLY